MDFSTIDPADIAPYNNQNYYQAAWKARAKVFDEIIPHQNNILDILNAFVTFDLTHDFFPIFGHAEGIDTPFLTGAFRVTPNNVPNARTIVRNHVSEETKRAKLSASLIDNNTQAVIELGCGYGLKPVSPFRPAGRPGHQVHRGGIHTVRSVSLQKVGGSSLCARYSSRVRPLRSAGPFFHRLIRQRNDLHLPFHRTGA
jgi:hypothetical protein